MKTKNEVVQREVNGRLTGRATLLHPCSDHSKIVEVLLRIDERVERILELLEMEHKP